jgi:phosphoglycolate phosphatase-like HAD superfamily hydrolase
MENMFAGAFRKWRPRRRSKAIDPSFEPVAPAHGFRLFLLTFPNCASSPKYHLHVTEDINHEAPMRLLLFDIDGTLLRVNGGAQTAVLRAVEQVAGQSVSIDDVPFSGRTDPAIFRDVLATNDLPVSENLLSDVLRAYVETARETIKPTNVTALRGTLDLLSLLTDRTDAYLGLVTGNVEPIAFHKLKAAGMDGYFSVGGFGSDHTNRSKLPPLALRRATEYSGHSFSVENTVVIGDTGHDIACARAAGARAVAVCTGRPSRRDLTSHTPDLLLESLEDAPGIVDQLLAV